jgi:hypothetical protein
MGRRDLESVEVGGRGPDQPAAQAESIFIGRERELAIVIGELDAAVTGSGRLILLSGEPGIGKSRFADELASVARTRGVPVLWGRCWEAGGASAYWPWVQGGRRPIGRRPRRPSFIGARRYSLRDGSLRVCVHGVRAPVRGAAPNVRDRHRGALPLMRRGARATPVHLLGGPPRWRLAIRRWRLRLRPRLRLQLGGSPPSRSNRSSSASRSGSTECFLERPLR